MSFVSMENSGAQFDHELNQKFYTDFIHQCGLWIRQKKASPQSNIDLEIIFGIGLIFYNSRKILGWLLSIGSITALIFGVIFSVRFSLRTMTSYDLIVIVIVVLAIAGKKWHRPKNKL